MKQVAPLLYVLFDLLPQSQNWKYRIQLHFNYNLHNGKDQKAFRNIQQLMGYQTFCKTPVKTVTAVVEI